MSGPMTEPREALATSICSTFDMGHHHHEAFLQPDHCDDGLSDADELLRSLRAQGYSVARSEGPGLDALRAVIAAVEAACPVCGGDGWTMAHDPADETGQTPMQVPCWDAEHSVILAAALAAQENPEASR